VIGLVAGEGALVAVGAVAVPRLLPDCAAEVTHRSGTRSTSPFLDAEERREQSDRHRDTVAAALEAAPPPYGEVLGAVGYHYEQWAQVGAFAQGIGVRTRNNPDFTLLDEDHVLIGGTTALHTLDLRTGTMTSAALPTDGINTTYWPYQAAVSSGLIAVATSTGAVVVQRE